jgi:hypothetical protein
MVDIWWISARWERDMVDMVDIFLFLKEILQILIHMPYALRLKNISTMHHIHHIHHAPPTIDAYRLVAYTPLTAELSLRTHQVWGRNTR